MNCYILNYAKSNFIDRNVVSNVFLKCIKYTVQLAVYYKRGDFYWIGGVDSSYSGKTVWFGDASRAMNR